jgi:hypothetical protein
VRSETKAVRSFTKSIRSVMGITSHQMEALPGTRAADSKDDSIRAADSRPILPSHRACAKKRAAKQRPSSESARYLGQSYSLKIMAVVELHIRVTRKERSMKSKRFILNALLVVAILTLLVFSYSYMNQPRFGYALYAVFSGETTYNTYNTIGFIDAIFFYVVGPVSSELIAFAVSYNLNQQSQTHSATSAKQGINLFVIMIILQIATVLIIALTATNVLKYEFGFIASCLMAIAAGIAVAYTTPAKK